MRVLCEAELPERLEPAEEDLVIAADNASVLPRLPSGFFDLVYVDPPFNTGAARRRQTLAVEQAAEGDGDRTGFGGRRYRSKLLQALSYDDDFADYLGFLEPRLIELRRVLAEHGTLYVHLDQREVHATKLLLDELFGRAQFLNELIWAYDYGGKTTKRWPPKHDTILVYVKDRRRYHFDDGEVERIPYLAPGLVTPEKVARGKRLTDVWWHTIVPTNGREKTGYPTQKPEGVVRRIVQASSKPGGWCLDAFAGSGTLGAVASQTGRRYVLIDENPEAVAVMRERLGTGSDGKARTER